MLRSLPMQKPDLVEHWIVLSLWRYVCNIQTWRILAILKLLQAYIEAGAAGVHFEGKNITYRHLYKPVFVHTLDQLGSEKKCGHMGFYFCYASFFMLLCNFYFTLTLLHIKGKSSDSNISAHSTFERRSFGCRCLRCSDHNCCQNRRRVGTTSNQAGVSLKKGCEPYF